MASVQRPFAFQDVRVWVRLGRTTSVVVDGASGTVAGGGFLAVLGASGAGKTSLLAALAGDGHDWEGAVDGPPGAPGFAPQDDCLLPFLTCRETLRFAAALRRRARDDAKADALLRTLGLEAVAASRVGSAERRGVSGGERKRLALGAELVADPPLLVADEPTSGLDSRAALAVARLLRDCAPTVVASVHQPGTKVFGRVHRLHRFERRNECKNDKDRCVRWW